MGRFSAIQLLVCLNRNINKWGRGNGNSYRGQVKYTYKKIIIKKGNLYITLKVKRLSPQFYTHENTSLLQLKLW